MNGKNFTPDNEECFAKGPQSELEKMLIDEYLEDKGYRLEDLPGLPQEESNRLMKEACMYASLKLAEIDAKARFRKKIKFDHP